MTTLPDRSNTALLVVDVQNGVVAEAHRRDEVVGTIAALVEAARDQDVPVIWVQHASDDLPSGSERWQIVPELPPADGEPVVHKRYGDAFEDTDLEARLSERAVGRLLVTGAQTEACVRATLHGAFVRGYDTVLVSDAHTTYDLTEHGLPTPAEIITLTNTYWTWQAGQGRTASVVPAADVVLTVPLSD